MARMPADPPSSNLRLRSKNSLILQSPFSDVDEDMKKPSNSRLSERVYLVIFIFYGFLFTLIFHADVHLPRAKSITRGQNGTSFLKPGDSATSAADKLGDFIEERARAHLMTLTSVGPRVVGSYENEVLAVDFLLREIGFIKGRCRSHFNFEVDVQKATGSFNLKFQDGFTSSYSKVKNVLVKLSPKDGGVEENSLLVNCHYDTAPGSPGASDDAVNCAIMLEVLNVIAQTSAPLKHSIVFSFNGAEENVLQAAHGFITQHKWAKPIRAFINLEACGSGGREIVFQAGPENPWLLQAYAENVPRPFASVLGQEIFASGVIPGDTDYRIYRDYGHVPGLDFAYVDNGYVYHTKYDRSEYISPGTIQRAGENILALVHHLASSSYLANPGPLRKGNIIFFDVLGFYLVTYTEMTGTIINLLTAVLSAVALQRAIRLANESGISPSVYVLNLGGAVVVTLLSWFAALFLVIVIANVVDWFGAAMSWFTYRVWVFGLYGASTLAALIAVQQIGSGLQKKFLLPYLKDNGWFLEGLYFEASRLIWVIVVVVLTTLQCRSCFLITIWVLLPTICRSYAAHYFIRRKLSSWKFVVMYLLSQVIACGVFMYAAFVVHYIFLPIMGRAGANQNPDVFVGVLMCGCTTVVTSFLITVVHVTQSVKRVFSVLVVIMFTSMAAVCFTSFGFPYSSNASHPTLQRYIVTHLHRKFHDRLGDVRREDSGFWVLPMDYNGPTTILPYVPELQKARFVPDDCPHELYCGMPYYFPVLTKLGISYYVEAAKPRLHVTSRMDLVSQKVLPRHQMSRRLTFNLTGPHHMAVFLSPSIHTRLVNWSFADGIPDPGPYWGDRPTYFIYYSRAEEPPNWSFWIDLELSPNQKTGERMLDIVMSSHNLHGPDQTTEELTAFVSKFPSWAYPVSWTGTYESWVFDA